MIHTLMNRQVLYKDLGLISYKEAWDLQETLHKEIVDQKLLKRSAPGSSLQTSNYLLFCEHPHVYTLGKSGKEQHLLINDSQLKENEAEYFQINRGGDITYHGPGQLVGYPILDLENFFTDIHKYLRYLEEAIIRTLKEYDIVAGRIAGLTGVWLDAEDQLRARKIAAFGVRCSRWITMHGFAFNVNTDLGYFGNIVPCGIDDKAVTSLEKELGEKIEPDEVKDKVRNHLTELFQMNLVEMQERSY
jgi:lipoyl(octanoyl) transferase